MPDESRYASMTYRRCGRSGIQLPVVSLGLWHNFGTVDHYITAKELILFSFDQGITHFDLANNYGPPPGSAEKTFGKILRKELKSYRNELLISTKAGYLMWPGPYGEWGSRKYLLTSLNRSLQRMELDYVDIFYSHRFDPKTPIEETMGALDMAVRSGKALYAGISNYSAEQTTMAISILRSLGTPCLIHQEKYSLLMRQAESGLSDVLLNEGVGCIAFSPLAQGLLTNRYLQGIPTGSRADKPTGFLQKEQITADILAKVKDLSHLADEWGLDLATLSANWVKSHRFITSVLVGVSSLDQLKNILRISSLPDFTSAQMADIEKCFTPNL